jgi:hypothetical protein
MVSLRNSIEEWGWEIYEQLSEFPINLIATTLSLAQIFRRLKRFRTI